MGMSEWQLSTQSCHKRSSSLRLIVDILRATRLMVAHAVPFFSCGKVFPTQRSNRAVDLVLLPLSFLQPQLLAVLGLVGERHPCRFGPVATLAHMIERRRLRLVPRLRGTGKKELQI